MAWNDLRPFAAGIILTLLSFSATAQNTHEWLLVWLKDKCGQDKPHPLSAEAMARRYLQGIEPDQHDLPVCGEYISALQEHGMDVIYSSRWLNTLLIKTSVVGEELAWLKRQPFVSEITYLGAKGKVASTKSVPSTRISANANKALKKINDNLSAIQLNHLHQLGYKGEGVSTAVIDAGFPGTDRLKAFNDTLFNKDWLKGGVDFYPGLNQYTRGMGHGTTVLSVMKANWGDGHQGAAPGADYWLLATESEYAEEPIEEFLLVKALEHADSAGVRVVNISLGYHTFDEPSYSYDSKALDGKTSIATRAAAIAATKGMVIVNSAGNDGKEKWKFIGFPADAQGVLSVGAVKTNGKAAKFSSHPSPTTPFITPRVAAPGVKVPVVFLNGMTMFADGTSYAAPLISSAVACLWQQYPHAKATDLVRAVEESASPHHRPCKQVGFGIPDMKKASELLSKKAGVHDPMTVFVSMRPLVIAVDLMPSEGQQWLRIVNGDQEVVWEKAFTIKARQQIIFHEKGWENLKSGRYHLLFGEYGELDVIDFIIP